MSDASSTATVMSTVFSNTIPDPLGIIKPLSSQLTAAKSMMALFRNIARRDAKVAERPRRRIQTFPSGDADLQAAIVLVKARLNLFINPTI